MQGEVTPREEQAGAPLGAHKVGHLSSCPPPSAQSAQRPQGPPDLCWGTTRPPGGPGHWAPVPANISQPLLQGRAEALPVGQEDTTAISQKGKRDTRCARVLGLKSGGDGI